MKFIKFLGVGGAATLIQYGILIALVEGVQASAVVGSTIGYIVSGIFNYTLNYYFTFSSTAKHRMAAIRFVIVAIIGLALNSSLVYLLTDVFSMFYIAAQVFATGVVVIWNFVAHKNWTYHSIKDH
ncbi:GtrA family protein [Marinobacter sp. GN3S48]|uniref:GtrA family protein n=1 Tax=Marinobacter sp. GN3S48 TaxID=3382302 RepID=UPI00387AF99E